MIWEKYFEDCHALIYVVDASDSSRLAEARAELGMAVTITITSNTIDIIMAITITITISTIPESILAHSDLGDAPLLVLANKQDLETATSGEKISARLNISKHQLSSVIETSSKST